MARVLETHPDEKGRVRTITVGVRDGNKGRRERADVCKTGLREMKAPVQRFAVVLPREEQGEK